MATGVCGLKGGFILGMRGAHVRQRNQDGAEVSVVMRGRS